MSQKQPPAAVPDVRPGQVWADNDPRSEGRTLRVETVEAGKAVCVILTDAGDIADRIRRAHAAGGPARGSVGRRSRISLSRFTPTSTGYRLVQDAEA